MTLQCRDSKVQTSEHRRRAWGLTQTAIAARRMTRIVYNPRPRRTRTPRFKRKDNNSSAD